ncbi:hypothetical protein NC652_006723 [Populus alba x Populus x berolinensis]|nr:hypothetical protein NC652_006723 [Populus alba x Populus x berolinensis]
MLNKDISRDSKGMKTSKNRKKHQKRKDRQKCAPEMHKKESNVFSSLCHNAKDDLELQSSLRETLKLQDVADVIFSPTVEFEDVDIDGEIDPALKEEIDSTDSPSGCQYQMLMQLRGDGIVCWNKILPVWPDYNEITYTRIQYQGEVLDKAKRLKALEPMLYFHYIIRSNLARGAYV